ncbi:hypothetical protein ACFX1X_001962 [Malus domestica]
MDSPVGPSSPYHRKILKFLRKPNFSSPQSSFHLSRSLRFGVILRHRFYKENASLKLIDTGAQLMDATFQRFNIFRSATGNGAANPAGKRRRWRIWRLRRGKGGSGGFSSDGGPGEKGYERGGSRLGLFL